MSVRTALSPLILQLHCSLIHPPHQNEADASPGAVSYELRNFKPLLDHWRLVEVLLGQQS